MNNHDQTMFNEARMTGRNYALARAEAIIYDVRDEADEYQAPNLSGEWAGDPTPASICRDFGVDDGDFATAELVVDGWETGVDDVWARAVSAGILRVQGRIAEAMELERALEGEYL